MVTKKLESSQPLLFILSYEFRFDVGLPSLFSNSTEYPLVVVGPLSPNADEWVCLNILLPINVLSL